MAKLTARGAAVLDRITIGKTKWARMSDGRILRNIDGTGWKIAMRRSTDADWARLLGMLDPSAPIRIGQ